MHDMICAHCNESFSRQGFSAIFRLGYKCPACGKLSYTMPVERRDPVSTFVVLGFVAAFVVLMFVAAESGNEGFMKYVPAMGLIGLIVMTGVLGFRGRHRYYTVTSLPPQELRKRRWFVGSAIVYLVSVSVYMAARRLDLDEGISFVVFMTTAIVFIVISFATRSSNANQDLS